MITGNFSICMTGPAHTPTTTQLTGSGGSGNPAPTTPWTSSNTAVATVDNTGLVTSVGFGTTTITYHDNAGNQVSQNIYVSNYPTISTNSNYATCATDTLQLNGSLFPNPTTPWTSLNPSIATVDNNGLVTGVSGGTATIVYMNISGCTASQVVTINPLHSPTVSCGTWANNAITFNWNAVLGAGTYTVVYSINNGTYTFGTSGNILTYTINNVAETDHVEIFVTPSGPVGYCYGGAFSCPSTPPCPEAGVLSGVQSICVGSSTSFTSTVAGGTWSSSNTDVATVNPTTGVITGLSAGVATMTYTVLGTGACPSAIVTRTVTVLTGTTNLFCDSNNLPPNSVGFDWAPVVGATDYNISYSINGGPTQTGSTLASNYQVPGVQPGQSVLFTLNSAVGVACFLPVSVTCTLLANSNFDADELLVYPNPVQNLLHIRDLKFISDISLFNAFGQQVDTLNNVSNNCVFDMSLLADGLYFVKITTQEQTKIIKIIKN